jgi:hypothetical protein
MAQLDTFKTRTTLTVGGLPYDIFSLKALAKQFPQRREAAALPQGAAREPAALRRRPRREEGPRRGCW